MVVFTCQHCNAALKKPVVEKHYNTKCRRTPYLTCVDCLNDFHGDEYISHTTCVSEDQRYGGQNFVAKPVAVKQNKWLEVVQSCIENNKNPKFIPILQRLKTSINVPRKKNKFINFTSNALNMKNTALAGEVYDLFQKEFEKESKNKTDLNVSKNGSPKTKGLENNKTDAGGKRDRVSESNCQGGNVSDDCTDSSLKKKKKKSKKNKTEQNGDSTEPLDEINDVLNHSSLTEEVAQTNSPSKKKKKNKENANDINGEEENNVSQIESGEKIHPAQEVQAEGTEKLSKKELKKLKKKQKYEAELKEIEVEKSVELSLENESEKATGEPEKEATKSKKKKRKAKVSESEADNKKKQKVEETIPEEIQNNLDGPIEEPVTNGKFDWHDVIKNVLRQSSDGELSVKRLSKKVLAEYQAIKGERESFEELISKFNKKVNKTPGVKILKDKAKLISHL